jgi:exosortase
LENATTSIPDFLGWKFMGRRPARNNPKAMSMQMTGRNALFLFFVGLSILMFYPPMKMLIEFSFDNEMYSHIILVPFVSIYLIYIQRREIFQESGASVFPGSVLIFTGIVFYYVGKGFSTELVQNDFLSVMTFAVVLFWIGSFIFFYGLESSRLALFPLLFLFFMVPVPGFLMERIILLLQIFSAEVSYGIFQLTNVPIFREGFTFHLPGLSVEVAKQCGGIRSSLVLFIVSILAGHLFLVSWKRKLILSLWVLPITIVKNAIRIVTLTLLAVYVDPRILDSTLHRRGGIPFFIVALSLLGIVLWFLRRSEESGGRFKDLNGSNKCS